MVVIAVALIWIVPKKEEEGDDDSNDENGFNRCKRNTAVPLTCAPKAIRWEKGILCLMPSPGQPWMLQRAKWEKFLRDDVDGCGATDGGNTSSSNPNEHKPNRREEAGLDHSRMEGWITSFNADEYRNGEGTSKLSTSVVGKGGTNRGVVVPEGISIVLQIGSCCRITDEVKAILCFYGNNRELKGASLQEGQIQ